MGFYQLLYLSKYREVIAYIYIYISNFVKKNKQTITKNIPVFRSFKHSWYPPNLRATPYTQHFLVTAFPGLTSSSVLCPGPPSLFFFLTWSCFNFSLGHMSPFCPQPGPLICLLCPHGVGQVELTSLIIQEKEPMLAEEL